MISRKLAAEKAIQMTVMDMLAAGCPTNEVADHMETPKFKSNVEFYMNWLDENFGIEKA